MTVINVLTKGFSSPNGCAFLFPLIKHQQVLMDCGITLHFHKKITKKLYDCDTLFVESKFFSRDWAQHTPRVLLTFELLRQHVEKIFYFDINDSTGWPHARVLPYVDRYVKNQALKNKLLYLKPFYGHRIYTDYYHRVFNVMDKEEIFSEVIADASLLDKLIIGWNSGLADYSCYGPYRMGLYNKMPISHLLTYPVRFTEVQRQRVNELSCRMGISYVRDSIAWQRRQIREKLKSFGHVKTDKLSRRQYYRELEESKLVVSPFGLGEITLKDFEVFLTGGLLVKPDMTHMETWPNFFQDSETMVSFNWDLDNIQERLQTVLSDYKKYIDIAEYGQDRYRHYLSSPEAPTLFADHFLNMLNSG